MDSLMGRQKSLSLADRLESPHPLLSHPGRLMGLLGPVIGILVIHTNGFRDHLPAGNTIAVQFVGHDLPRFATIATYQSSEIERAKLDAPQSDQFPSDDNASFGELACQNPGDRFDIIQKMASAFCLRQG